MTAASAMTGSKRRFLWTLIVFGVVIRLVLAFATDGDAHDMESYDIVGRALLDDPLHVYENVNAEVVDRWPYPSGYFPWIALVTAARDATGVSLDGLIQLAPIAADAVIAWLVQDFLGRRGAAASTRLWAAGAVALGPSFVVISGYQGQFDAVAILPALLGFIAWERGDRGRRPLAAGMLIGLAGALKIVPLLVLLPLLPSARSIREAATLCAAAGAVVVAVMLPFLAVDPAGVADSIGYGGLAGIGGLTLALQPTLAENWLSPPASVDPSWLVGRLASYGTLVSVVMLGAVTAFLLRYRPRATDGATLLWLAVYVFATGFFFQYLLWGLPFFLLAGHVRQVVALQAALVGPAVIFYVRPWDWEDVWIPYATVMVAVWATLAVALALVSRRAVKRTPSPSTT